MSEERRRYFRITDNVGIAYRRLTDEELNAHETILGEPLQPLSRLSDINRQLDNLISQIGQENPLLSQVVKLLDQKVNGIIYQMELEAELVQNIAYKVKEANLSACGIAVELDDDLKKSDRLVMELTLGSERSPIVTGAVVIACQKGGEDGRQYVRLDFFGMSHGDQEKLIQHMVKRQSALLRESRQPQESTS